jgi:hypothetical protein
MMNVLNPADCERLRDEVSKGTALSEALSKIIGGSETGTSVWRLYSNNFPLQGVLNWNADSVWKREWKLPTKDFHAFGEDIFGNQLIIQPCISQVVLWNHENGSLVDLLLDPITLLETVVENGLSWIDFYADGSLKVAEAKISDLPYECHLHWTTPLILGGQVSSENTSIVERSMHLVGHARLWNQLHDQGPGSHIIVKPQS